MKEIVAVIRMNMMNVTKRALADIGISSMTAKDALGRGKGIIEFKFLNGAAKGYEEAISQLGQNDRLIPKRILFIAVPDKLVQKAVKTIIKINQTGKSGDGKIFILPLLDSVRVRTGESGDNVLDDD
ncbi:MAG: P-II family nitrogen regulator [Desulfobacterales bacterium]|nr:P-II family nitrogen regulator [Desulfobacterales bacterium]